MTYFSVFIHCEYSLVRGCSQQNKNKNSAAHVKINANFVHPLPSAYPKEGVQEAF